MDITRVMFLGALNNAPKMTKILEMFPKDYRPFPDSIDYVGVTRRTKTEENRPTSRPIHFYPELSNNKNYSGRIKVPDGATKITISVGPAQKKQTERPENSMLTVICSFRFKNEEFVLHRSSTQFLKY